MLQPIISTIEDRLTIAHHKKINGDAFSFNQKTGLVVCGGRLTSNLIDVNKLDQINKDNILIDAPYKWPVSNYDWDVHFNYRYLQSRNKLIEIVDIERLDYVNDLPKVTLIGHSASINEVKWSPFKAGCLASCANDSYVYLWDIDMDKPVATVNSIGGAHCLAWSKIKENMLAITCNNDIKIYDTRKLNSVLRYIHNAHSKKISSIDWCHIEDKFMTCSRDKTINIWPGHVIDYKLEPIKLDFQCWKAKYLPSSHHFAVIPTCTSTSMNQKALISPFYKQLSPTVLNSSTTSISHLLTQQSLNNDSNNNFNIIICQSNNLNQIKNHRYSTNKCDMIIDYDFYINDETCSIIAWTKGMCLVNCALNPLHITSVETAKLGDDTVDSSRRLIVQQPSTTNINTLPHQSMTSTSSRKSSFSEYGNHGTPPTTYNGMQAVQALLNTTAVNSSDESMPMIGISQSLLALQQQQQQQQQQLVLNSQQSKSSISEFVPYPKCFGAKFSGLPQHLIVYQNLIHHKSILNQFKIYPKQYIPQNEKTNDRRNQKHKPFTNKQTKLLNKSNLKKNCVHIIDITNLLSINYELAANYIIMHPDNKIATEQNYIIALKKSRIDIAKIWELLKFITTAHSESISLNPDHGRPWPCSSFGRPLVNYIIENCVKLCDIQTIVMIIAKLLQHDKSLIPIRSSVHRHRHHEMIEYDLSDRRCSNSIQLSINENTLFPYFNQTSNNNDDGRSYDSDITLHHKNLGLLDPDRTSEYDYMIKYYCDILYRWGLYIKRAELYEYIHDKPSEFDAKFECPYLCVKCGYKTISSKCTRPECKAVNLYCSLCQLPVHGLSAKCIMCGHGGHYEHMIEWFKRQEDCAAACGCRCIDFI